MATLNIKNFPDPLYQMLQEQAQREHRSMAQELDSHSGAHLRTVQAPFHHGARGAREGFWEGIDPAAYIREERDSWDS